MYDPKLEPREFYGDDLSSARAAATSHFGCAEEELTIREVQRVHGIGARVVVVAQRTDAIGRAPQRREGGRSPRPGQRRSRPGGPRGGPASDEGERDERSDGADHRARGPARQAAPAVSELPEEPAGPSTGTAEGEIGEVGAYLLGVIERMELGPFQISVQEQGKFQVYKVAGAAARSLTTGGTRAPEALQILANQVAGILSDQPQRIVVDVEGNREKREAFLARLADRAAKRAIETGRTVTLEPMNGKDRREIHTALRDMENVATMGIGEGAYRQVLVVPEGAPEFEEALEASQRAQQTES